MKLEHLITKKIERKKRRLFFRFEGDEPVEFSMSMKNFWLTDLYVMKVSLKKGINTFWVDVPVWVWRLTGLFRWIAKSKNTIETGYCYNSRKYERLI